MDFHSEIILPNLIPYNNNGKWGYCKPLNYSEKLRNPYAKINYLILDCIYDSAEPFEDGLALVKLSDKYFFITKNGEVHNNIKYDKIYPYSEGLAAVVKNNKIGFINTKNNLIIPFDYLHTDEKGYNFNDFIFKDGLVKVRKLIDNEIVYGFIDKNGQIVIPFDYSYLSDFDNGVAFGEECDRLYLNYGFSVSTLKDFKKSTILLNKNNEVVRLVGGRIDEFKLTEGFTIISIIDNYDVFYSFINNRGERVHAFYNYVRPFNEGFAYVSISGNYPFPKIDEDRIKHANFVDKSGLEISKIRFEHASDFLGGFATIRLNKKWGLLDSKGEITLPCISDEFIIRKGEICIIKINNKYCLVNVYGEFITDVEYDEIEITEKDIVIVKIDNKWGFLNTNGSIITECIYDEVGSIRNGQYILFYDGIIVVKANDKYGYITENGVVSECIFDSENLELDEKPVTEINYHRYKNLSDNLIAVKEQNSKWGIINKDGKLLVDFIYDDVKEYDEQIGCIATYNGKYGLIDKFGKVKIDFIFERISFLSNTEYLEVSVKSGKWPETKIFDLNENKILDYIPDNVMKTVIGKSTLRNKYTKCYDFKNNIALIYNREQFGYIDIFGNEYFKHKTTTSEYYEEVNSLRKRANPMDAFDDYEQYIDWYDN